MLKKMLWCLRMLLKIKLERTKVKTSSIRENCGTVLAAGLMELLLFLHCLKSDNRIERVKNKTKQKTHNLKTVFSFLRTVFS